MSNGFDGVYAEQMAASKSAQLLGGGRSMSYTERIDNQITETEKRLSDLKQMRELVQRNPDIEQLLNLMQRNHV